MRAEPSGRTSVRSTIFVSVGESPATLTCAEKSSVRTVPGAEGLPVTSTTSARPQTEICSSNSNPARPRGSNKAQLAMRFRAFR
jgi:hypothetical protein